MNHQIENALNTIVNQTEKIGNTKKDLKHSLHETVSNLRKLVFILKSNMLEETEESNKTRNEVKQMKATLEKWKSTTSERQAVPSVTSFTVLTSHGTAVSSTPSGGKRKLFSEILSGKNAERNRLTVNPNDKTAEEIKKLLRTRIDAVNMKIGIRTFKNLRN